MPVKTAVIGAGAMGNGHLGQLNTIPDVQVVAVVDPHEPAVRAAAERHRVPSAYPDIESMLTAERPDYVVVASPVKYHAPQAIAAIEAGAHVRFDDGASMSIEGNWLMHPYKRGNGFEINGILGVARDVAPFVELEHGKDVFPFELEYDPEPENDTRQEHVEFVEAIQGRGRPIVTFREALVVQRILVGLYDSAEQNREVRV